jgi:hypothetical protein
VIYSYAHKKKAAVAERKRPGLNGPGLINSPTLISMLILILPSGAEKCKTLLCIDNMML